VPAEILTEAITKMIPREVFERVIKAYAQLGLDEIEYRIFHTNNRCF